MVYRFVANDPTQPPRVYSINPREQQQQQQQQHYYYQQQPDDAPQVIRIGPGYLESGQVIHMRGGSDPRNVRLVELPSGVLIVQSGTDHGTWHHPEQRRVTIPIQEEIIQHQPRVQRAYGQRSMSDSVRQAPAMVTFNVDGRRASLEQSPSPPPRDRVYVIRMASSESPSPPSTLKKFDEIVSQRYRDQEPKVSTLTRRIEHSTPPTPATPPSNTPSNLFNKYRFHFGSIGQLSEDAEEHSSPTTTFRFSDFDDMVARIREAEPDDHPRGGQGQLLSNVLLLGYRSSS